MLRIILSAALILCSGISAAWPGDPEQLPLDVEKAGSVTTLSIDAKEQYVYTFEIGYGFKDGDKDASHNALKLSGISGRNKDTGEILRPGASVPLELTIIDMDAPGNPTIFFTRAEEEEKNALMAGAGGMMYYTKSIASCRLKPGHYKVNVKVLKATPELSNIPVILTYSMPAH